METKSAIFTRRSVRNYNPAKRASDKQINDVLNAAMHAPTAMDKQPWEFLVLTDDNDIHTILKICPYCDFLVQAGTAIVVCGDKNKQFQTPDGGYYVYDCSAAAQNLLLRAKELGLDTCWCAVAPEKTLMESFRKAFNIPQYVDPMAFIVLGYAASDVKLDKERFDITKIHRGRW